MTKKENKNNIPSDNNKMNGNDGFEFDQSRNNFEIEDNNLIEYKKILKSLIRRKKLIIVISSSIFLVSTISTVYKRIFNPIYQGSFSLLIKDMILFVKD